MNFRLLVIASCLLFFKVGDCQIGAESTPVSWNMSQSASLDPLWQTLPLLDVEALIDEDSQNEDKSVPYRFASAIGVHFDPQTSGQWINLPGGDRLWMLGIRCQNALSLSVTFGMFDLPEGAKMYIYDGGHKDYVGPLTVRNNTGNKVFATIPIRGSEVVVEYYEPFEYRGNGKFFISSVARAYRDLSLYPSAEDSPCMNLLDDENSSKDISNASSSVLMMLTDNGQRMATAVMVNNSKFDGTIYAFTSSSALLGDPAAFVFVVDLVIGNCSSVSVCWDKALSGASLIKTDPVSGITLLQLAGRPRKQWKTYLSGWDISDHAGSGFFSITHGLTRPQQLSVYAGSLLSSTWKEVPTVDCSPWESGGIFQGAVGGPLFNSKGQIVGIYTGGAPACGESSHDHFALLSLSWNSFRPYLDPFVTPSSKLLGSSPQYGNEEGTQKKELIVLYPNPAYDRIIIQNNSTEEIVEVVIYDNTGRVLLHTTDFFPWLDLKGLSSGHYFLRVVQPSGFSMEQFIVR